MIKIVYFKYFNLKLCEPLASSIGKNYCYWIRYLRLNPTQSTQKWNSLMSKNNNNKCLLWSGCYEFKQSYL